MNYQLHRSETARQGTVVCETIESKRRQRASVRSTEYTRETQRAIPFLSWRAERKRPSWTRDPSRVKRECEKKSVLNFSPGRMLTRSLLDFFTRPAPGAGPGARSRSPHVSDAALRCESHSPTRLVRVRNATAPLAGGTSRLVQGVCQYPARLPAASVRVRDANRDPVRRHSRLVRELFNVPLRQRCPRDSTPHVRSAHCVLVRSLPARTLRSAPSGVINSSENLKAGLRAHRFALAREVRAECR